MLALGFLLTLSAGLVLVQGDIDDFDDFNNGYEFIYHDAKDLILIKHDSRCYFVNFPDNKESELVDNPSYNHMSYLKATENSLLNHVWNNRSGDVRESSLTAVRAKYHDILADFQCTDKRIFEFNLVPETPTYHPDYQNHHNYNTPGPGSYPNSGGEEHLCSLHHLSDGMHPYPGNCYKFLVCSGGMTFVQACADGTAFSGDLLGCIFSNQVPGCHYSHH